MLDALGVLEVLSALVESRRPGVALKTTRGGLEDADFGLVGCLSGSEAGTVTVGPEEGSCGFVGCVTGVELEAGTVASGGPEDDACCGLGSGLDVVGFEVGTEAEVVDSGMIGRVNGI